MYANLLKAKEKKTDEYEQDITKLELQINQLTGDNEELTVQNATFKEEIGKLETLNAELHAACANWKDQALCAMEELAALKEADKKVLEILQKRV